jgi:septal ring factor EnvC (AmiA/AmiB activator)
MNPKVPRLHRLAVAWWLLAWLCGAPMSPDAEEANPARPAAEPTKSLREDMDKLRKESNQLKEEVAKLREEVALLRRENQQLRRLIAERAEITGTNAPARAVPTPAQPPHAAIADSALTHWLSSLSGKRHNSNCRYFKTTDGTPCRAHEGQACKICGG